MAVVMASEVVFAEKLEGRLIEKSVAARLTSAEKQ